MKNLLSFTFLTIRNVSVLIKHIYFHRDTDIAATEDYPISEENFSESE